MLYDGWTAKIVKRFQVEFDQIVVNHNFDYGSEFEIAVCKVLRTVLPQRASVCRGYVVGADGRKAGDDIIVFDSSQFPTLRALGSDLSKKEEVPAEAVLAYIEAKHTLDVVGEGGQSLLKACRQAAAPKVIQRAPVALGAELGLDMSTVLTVTPAPNYPRHKNPWYSAVWCRKIRVPKRDPRPEHLQVYGMAGRQFDTLNAYPDVVAGGSTFIFPANVPRNPAGEVTGDVSAHPFLCEGTELVVSPAAEPLGLATLHLLNAIEWIKLGSIPWGRMALESLTPPAAATPPMSKPAR